MGIWRRFILGVVVAVICVGVWDYGKHMYALNVLKKEDRLKLTTPRISFYRKGFRIHAQAISYDAVSAQDVRMRIPFLSTDRALVWARKVTFGKYFVSKKTKFFLTFDSKMCRITYFYMKDNTLTVFPTPVINHHISGHADIAKDNINYTIHATMLSSAGHDLSTLTSFGGITYPYDGRRKGELRFKLSHTHPILDLLTQNDTLKGWQKDLLMQAFNKDVVIPIDIRGTYIYMGPIKLAEIG